MSQHGNRRGFVASWLRDHSPSRFFGVVGFALIWPIWGILAFSLPPAIGWYLLYAFFLLWTVVIVGTLISGMLSEPSTKLMRGLYWVLLTACVIGVGVYEWTALPLPNMDVGDSAPVLWFTGGVLVLMTLYLANSFSRKQRLFSRIDENGRIA